ncbi:autotransporter domain-containing protein [Qipengyuania qiaonensis]|uniref:Autotransporter domain-containing protein n=1 Tax=Qipengyuania qiaonensis TaxID=2867240 RepID=A0ABS7JC57_9SPHN|nr:autotransporter domain-containing protein [Qipengyuania qiaonensis]MBX7483268.1 autotransporter domain-containing protein [Qipengyuania qiaonensis]
MKSNFTRMGGRLMAGAATIALSAVALSTPAHAIVPNDNVDPNADRSEGGALDTDDEFSGIGMFFRADGFVCSGSLINPRTVLFAAHCVNDRAATDYNVDNVPAAWSFNPNALPGFQNWFAGFQSNPDLAVFNVNRIYYDPRSLEDPAALGFLEGDVAIASLDTPAANLPTWSLLFSPLPDPGAIDDVDGTGYHVNITGYGRSGNGTNGDIQGIDWRRRAAENMIGSLTSFDARNTFLFGDPSGDLPQVLYRLDFDDPNKTNPFDFNLYKDEPRENEGTTAGGDSGGPLILDAANNAITDEDLVIGVLSGGSRFFGAQEFSSYGTESFYQPLFLYWDWIAANNPYRYVTAKAGDGAWEDASHWETTLDPNYRIIDADGNIVNGVPTSPGAGTEGGAPEWGEVCFDPEGDNLGDGCQDLSTGEFTPPARNVGDTMSSGIGKADADMLDALGGGTSATPETASAAEGVAFGSSGALSRDSLINAHESQNGAPEFSEEAPHASDGGSPEFSDDPLPDPTLDNGLPGASDFVPDNIDPVVSTDATVNVDPRYFDVTLGNAGTTTLSSAVTIDRLTVLSTAGLNITADGSLTSLIDISQFGGTITVDGALNSVGDYTLFGGALQGGGTITAPFVTNIMGAISPGTIGGIDTLTIDGSLVLSSGSTLMIDIGADGASDLVAVTGEASVGGVVAIGLGSGTPAYGNGQQFTVLTADGGVTGTFVEGDISAILSQTFTYTDTAVLMEIIVASYATAIDSTDPVQVSYAQLFDQNRTNAALAYLYVLDFADADTIQATFEGLAPVAESAVRQLTAQSYNHLQSFNASRLRESDLASSGGTIATLGSPIQTAQMTTSRSSQPVLAGALGLDQASEPTRVQQGAIREDVGIYVAGGLIRGSGTSTPGYTTEKTDVDGYFFAGGIEYFPSESSMVGLSAYYSDLEADVVLGQEADSKMLAVSLYGSVKTEVGIVVDGQVSLTDVDIDTTRTVSFVGDTQTLTSESSDGGLAAAVGVSYDIEGAFGTISPGVELRYADHSFDVVEETGGPLALRIDREDFESLQGRIGLDYQKVSGTVQIDAHADWVHEFEDGPLAVGAQFAAGNGPAVPFAVASTDSDWGEIGLSAQFGTGAVQFGLGVDTTISRKNANAQSYRAMATFKF